MILYDNFDGTGEYVLDTIVFDKSDYSLRCLTDHRGSYSNGVFRSNSGYTSFIGAFDFLYIIPLSQYDIVTVWLTLLDNSSNITAILDVPGSSDITLIHGVSVPLTVKTSSGPNITRINVTFNDTISTGVTVDRVEFKSSIPPHKTIMLRSNTTTDVKLGNGITQSKYPGLESYYIEGRVSLKGNPVHGALLKYPHDGSFSTIIPTQPNGKYFHYMPVSTPMTLIAYSQWHNHNSMIRENVRPNSQFRSQIGNFTYN